jgi:hypothetical protein
MRELFIAWFGAAVLLFFALRGALDLLASIDYAQETFPLLKRVMQTKKWHRLLLSATCLFYAYTLYGLLQGPPFIKIEFADPGEAAIRDVVKENRDLKAELAKFTEPEAPDSLRRRTMKAANALNDFWIRHPIAPPVLNPKTDDDRKRNETYWNEVNRIYDTDYKETILGIIREYKTKGVPTGRLEQSAENHPFGGAAFSMANGASPICFQDELCQFRELAFHVDARDQKLGPIF